MKSKQEIIKFLETIFVLTAEDYGMLCEKYSSNVVNEVLENYIANEEARLEDNAGLMENLYAKFDYYLKTIMPVEEGENFNYSDSCRIYLKEIGRIPMLTDEQEKDMAIKLKEKRQIINDTIKMIAGIINKFMNSNLSSKAIPTLEKIDNVLEQKEVFLQKVDNEELKNKLDELFRLLEKQKKSYKRLFDDFCHANLRLVIKFANKNLRRGLSLGDLVQAGNMGVMKAVEKFDVDRGYKFSTCAFVWIKQCITREIQNTGTTIRIPAYYASKMTTLYIRRQQLEKELGREATIKELAEDLELPIEKVEDMLIKEMGTVSLEGVVGSSEDYHYIDMVSDQGPTPDEIYEEKETKRTIEDAITEVLSDREAYIIKERFGLNNEDPDIKTLGEIGKKFKVTRERVRQIEKNALRKLQKKIKK